MVETSCPVCNKSNWGRELVYKGFRLLKCNTCGLIRTEITGKIGGPDKEIYGSREEVERQFATQAEKFQKYANDLLDLLNLDGGLLLDVGSGPGWLVAQAQGRGFQAIGIDSSRTLVEFGKKRLKLKLIASSLEDYTTREKFDVIVLKHVLEHTDSPNKFLQKIRILLKPSGTVLVACPNIRSLMFWIFRCRWYGLVPAQHRWQFTAKTLSSLLQKNGFKIQKTIINSLDYDAKGIKGKLLNLIVVLANLTGFGDQVVIIASK